METAANVHDSVELPDVVTLAMVIVDVPADPALTVTLVGLAVMVKSGTTVNVTVTE